VLRRAGRGQVVACEGGHVGYAAVDSLDDAIVGELRRQFGRVSAERMVSGPGLANINSALAAIEDRAPPATSDEVLWRRAASGEDAHARRALERLCWAFGNVAGDLALAQGAKAVVVAGALALRMIGVLRASAFEQRFVGKGRFEVMMRDIPVHLVTHPQMGLLGAAACFAEEHRL
jgi:glucokinase